MRQRKGEQKREQLRRAAYVCFRDDGYHETTVDAICQRAGSSKGSFYWHYSSKQEVFIDILEAWSREVMDELYEQFEESVHQADYVSAIKAALVRELHRGRVIIPLWLEFTLQARDDGEMQRALAKFYRRARLALVEILRPILEDEVSEDELKGVAATIFGAYAGLLMQDLSDPRHANASEMIDMTMAVVGNIFHRLKTGNKALTLTTSLQPGKRAEAQSVVSLCSDLSAQSMKTFEQLRQLIWQIEGGVDERVISGWHQLAFEVPESNKGLFCYLKPMKKQVRLGFYQGSELEDRDGVLKGRGKQQRYMDIEEGTTPDVEGITSLLRQAYRLHFVV